MCTRVSASRGGWEKWHGKGRKRPIHTATGDVSLSAEPDSRRDTLEAPTPPDPLCIRSSQKKLQGEKGDPPLP